MIRFQAMMPVTIIRRVTPEADGGLTINDEVTEAFLGRVYTARRSADREANDGSLRAHFGSNPDLLWYKPGQATGRVNAGDRLVFGSVVYEALAGTIEKRAATQTLILETRLAPVTSLYPSLAGLRELGGAMVEPDLPCAVWSDSINDTDRGTYERLTAELPPEHYDALRVTNRQLDVAGTVHHIDQVTLHTGQPRVTATLREKV